MYSIHTVYKGFTGGTDRVYRASPKWSWKYNADVSAWITCHADKKICQPTNRQLSPSPLSLACHASQVIVWMQRYVAYFIRSTAITKDPAPSPPLTFSFSKHDDLRRRVLKDSLLPESESYCIFLALWKKLLKHIKILMFPCKSLWKCDWCKYININRISTIVEYI